MIHVRFTCDDPPTDLVALLGPDRVDVSSGYGGWDEVERPQRSTVTTWKGQPARRMSVPIIFDEWVSGESVELEIRRLERMALPRPGGQPPTVRVAAAGGVIPPYLEALDWVIDAISWGDALANQNWNRTRQAATITLLEYISDELIAIRSSAKRKRAKRKRATGASRKKGAKQKRAASKGKRKTTRRTAVLLSSSESDPYTGEDLLSVAARELGDARRWIEIAALNGIRDPRAIKRGQVIRLP